MRLPPSDRQSTLRAILNSPVALLCQDRSAIVLERVAHGAGTTNWFLLEGRRQLDSVVSRLLPGSCVSFYFDDRIARCPWDDGIGRDILRIADEDGDAVVGRLGADGIEIDVAFVSDADELTECFGLLDPGTEVFFGRFPARDDDGKDAVTLTLPDADGVVRDRPH